MLIMSETRTGLTASAAETKQTTPKKTATAKKPAAAKKIPAAKPAAEAKPAVSKKPAAPKKAAASEKTGASKNIAATVGAEARYKMIEEAAYYLAEQRGFSGNSADYWITAEAQINQQLGKR
jgi:alpha-beta hydrolase superfamily lysophospholipase